MDIPKTLPQFEDEQALFIIAGAKIALVYRAAKGSIEKIYAYEAVHPTYSDREGFFVQSSGGERMGSGAVYEEDKEGQLKLLLTELQKGLATTIAKDIYSAVYLAAPMYVLPAIKEALPVQLQGMLKQSVAGNLTKEHPIQMLTRFRKESD